MSDWGIFDDGGDDWWNGDDGSSYDDGSWWNDDDLSFSDESEFEWEPDPLEGNYDPLDDTEFGFHLDDASTGEPWNLPDWLLEPGGRYDLSGHLLHSMDFLDNPFDTLEFSEAEAGVIDALEPLEVNTLFELEMDATQQGMQGNATQHYLAIDAEGNIYEITSDGINTTARHMDGPDHLGDEPVEVDPARALKTGEDWTPDWNKDDLPIKVFRIEAAVEADVTETAADAFAENLPQILRVAKTLVENAETVGDIADMLLAMWKKRQNDTRNNAADGAPWRPPTPDGESLRTLSIVEDAAPAYFNAQMLGINQLYICPDDGGETELGSAHAALIITIDSDAEKPFILTIQQDADDAMQLGFQHPQALRTYLEQAGLDRFLPVFEQPDNLSRFGGFTDYVRQAHALSDTRDLDTVAFSLIRVGDVRLPIVDAPEEVEMTSAPDDKAPTFLQASALLYLLTDKPESFYLIRTDGKAHLLMKDYDLGRTYHAEIKEDGAMEISGQVAGHYMSAEQHERGVAIQLYEEFTDAGITKDYSPPVVHVDRRNGQPVAAYYAMQVDDGHYAVYQVTSEEPGIELAQFTYQPDHSVTVSPESLDTHIEPHVVKAMELLAPNTSELLYAYDGQFRQGALTHPQFLQEHGLEVGAAYVFGDPQMIGTIDEDGRFCLAYTQNSEARYARTFIAEDVIKDEYTIAGLSWGPSSPQNLNDVLGNFLRSERTVVDVHSAPEIEPGQLSSELLDAFGMEEDQPFVAMGSRVFKVVDGRMLRAMAQPYSDRSEVVMISSDVTELDVPGLHWEDYANDSLHDLTRIFHDFDRVERTVELTASPAGTEPAPRGLREMAEDEEERDTTDRGAETARDTGMPPPLAIGSMGLGAFFSARAMSSESWAGRIGYMMAAIGATLFGAARAAGQGADYRAPDAEDSERHPDDGRLEALFKDGDSFHIGEFLHNVMTGVSGGRVG